MSLLSEQDIKSNMQVCPPPHKAILFVFEQETIHFIMNGKLCGFKHLTDYILEGFHGWDLMVVVGFLGCLAMFWRFFFLASSEDRS